MPCGITDAVSPSRVESSRRRSARRSSCASTATHQATAIASRTANDRRAAVRAMACVTCDACDACDVEEDLSGRHRAGVRITGATTANARLPFDAEPKIIYGSTMARRWHNPSDRDGVTVQRRVARGSIRAPGRHRRCCLVWT